MGNIRHSNNASTTLASGITNVATSITVAASTGALFPAVGAGLYAMLTIENALGNIEVVKLTSRAGDVLTVVRAQEGTVGFAFSSGARIENRCTAATLNEYYQRTGDSLLGQLDANSQTILNPIMSGMITGSYKVSLGGSGPIFRVENTAAGSDLKLWSWQSNSSGDYFLRTRTDADVAGENILRFTRSAAVNLKIELGNVAENPVYEFLGTGKITTGGVIELGHASDTTISRLSAGVAAVEGSAIITQAVLTAQIPTFALNTSQSTPTVTTDGNNHIVTSADHGSIRRMTQAGGSQTVTVGVDCLGGTGKCMLFIREGTATVDFSVSGTTLDTKGGSSISMQQGAVVLLQKTTTLFHLIGDV